jgi:intracellular multiplication protein IcmT
MSDEPQSKPSGYWRNASRALHVYGIPAPLFLLYLFWFRFPSLLTLEVVSGVIAAFRLLSYFGWTYKVLIARLLYRVRGNKLSGRPWWYRRFTEGG